MKALRVFVGLISLLIYLPIHVYGSWLLYNHIHATDLMWFLWWMMTPIMLLSSIINAVMDKIIDKK